LKHDSAACLRYFCNRYGFPYLPHFPCMLSTVRSYPIQTPLLLNTKSGNTGVQLRETIYTSNMEILILFILICNALLGHCQLTSLEYEPIQAFDCNTRNVTTSVVSLNEPALCLAADYSGAVKWNKKVIVFQEKSQPSMDIYNCRVTYREMRQTCYYGGIVDHDQEVHLKLEVSMEECKRAHEEKHFFGDKGLGRVNVSDSDFNKEFFVTRPIVGKTSNRDGGGCIGGEYKPHPSESSASDSNEPFKTETYKNIVVYRVFKIYIAKRTAVVNLAAGTLAVTYQDEFYYGIKGTFNSQLLGRLYWDNNMFATGRPCPIHKYQILYKGIANFTEYKNRTIMQVDTGNLAIALEITGVGKLCSQRMLATSEVKMLVYQQEVYKEENEVPEVFQSAQKPLTVDLLSYVNNKFLFVEAHISGQVIAITSKLLYYQCQLRREAYILALGMCWLAPENCGYFLFKKPGVHSSIRGESVRIVHCQEKRVYLRSTKKCTQYLPVHYGNKSEEYYIAPMTRILTTFSPDGQCQRLAPIYYKLKDSWIVSLPEIEEANAPQALDPNIVDDIAYIPVFNLTNKGLYSAVELERFQTELAYGYGKKVAIAMMQSAMVGESTSNVHMFHPANMFSEFSVETLFEKVFSKIFSWLSFLGIYTSAFFGLYFCVNMAWFVFGSIMRGVMIYKVAGVSCVLAAALCEGVSSFIHYILIRRWVTAEEDKQRRNREEETELRRNTNLSDSQVIASQPLITRSPFRRTASISQPIRPRQVRVSLPKQSSFSSLNSPPQYCMNFEPQIIGLDNLGRQFSYASMSNLPTTTNRKIRRSSMERNIPNPTSTPVEYASLHRPSAPRSTVFINPYENPVDPYETPVEMKPI